MKIGRIGSVFVILAILTAITLSSCGTGAGSVKAVGFFYDNSDEVSEMISAIPEASFETEAAIDEAYNKYCELSEEAKDQVTNYDTLESLRYDLAKLYNTVKKSGDRIDRSKLLIGTYCVASYCWDDEHMKAIKDCGIDFITSASYNETFLNLCEKYELGAFVTYLPGWWGGDGSNSGQLQNTISTEAYENSAANFADSPAIWAMDVGDEPSAADFPYYGVLINKAKELFPDKMIYLNLYPNYANEQQMGVATYKEHIDEYVKNVDLDYICYDHYVYSSKDVGRMFDNLGIVASACRDTGRDMWIVLQVNSDDSSVFISEQQLRFQAYTALAFGAKSLNWACWTAGWYNNQVVDGNGNYTEQYDKLCTVNKELIALGSVYMRYTATDTAFISRRSSYEQKKDFVKNSDNVLDEDVFKDLRILDDNSVVLAGYFEKNSGNGSALMLVNVNDYTCEKESEVKCCKILDDGRHIAYACEEYPEAEVTFALDNPDAVVTAYYRGIPTTLVPEDGIYKVTINNGDGVFVTVG